MTNDRKTHTRVPVKKMGGYGDRPPGEDDQYEEDFVAKGSPMNQAELLEFGASVS